MQILQFQYGPVMENKRDPVEQGLLTNDVLAETLTEYSPHEYINKVSGFCKEVKYYLKLFFVVQESRFFCPFFGASFAYLVDGL